MLDLLERRWWCVGVDTCGEAAPSTIMLLQLPFPPKDATGDMAAYVVAGE